MDGHYSLDLSNQMDKFCLNKLLELGMTIAFRRAKKRYALYCCVVVYSLLLFAHDGARVLSSSQVRKQFSSHSVYIVDSLLCVWLFTSPP
jgi:hypothetical protein